MADSGKIQRRYERKQLPLSVRIRGHESAESEWSEITRLIDVTPLGTRFILKRLTEKGRILHLTVAMPRQYRCFDHTEDQYRVWALVRWTSVLEPMTEDEMLLDVGVAFVGKHPPAGYLKNPLTRFSAEFAIETGETKIWEYSSLASDPHSYANRREESRYRIPIDASLEVLNTSGQVIRTEFTVTEEISLKGASVYTEFAVPSGQFVRLTSAQLNASVIAVVRSAYTKEDNLTRLGLEYVKGRLPLAGIEPSDSSVGLH